ncbi:MAG: penicillin-binding protein activator LpoB [Holophagales bacterium]|jgi:hypothetical protein|nr:penicillin-binding protein activator LpoB [Holophagales bacterium]
MVKFHSCFKAFVLCLAAIISNVLQAQDQRPSVAVLEPVANAQVTQINKMTAYGALQQYIINSRRYKVVDRSRIDQIMKEHTFAKNGLVDNSKVKEIGKLLAADLVCVSELRKEDGAFIAVCSLIDVETGEMSASAYELIEADTAVEVRNAINRAVMTMLGIEDSRSSSSVVPLAPSKPTGASELQDSRQSRIAVIIPEVHLTRRIPDPAGETAIIRKLLEAGFTRVVDKTQVEKIRNSDIAKSAMAGDVDAIKGIATQLGVDYIMVGEAFSEAVGPTAGGMFSCRARVEAKIIRTDNARIIATNGFHAGGVDLTESTSAKAALNNAGEMMGDYMVKQLLSVGGTTSSGVNLTVTGARSYAQISEFEKALRAVKGIDNVRINEYSSTIATIDITTSLSVQSLADQLRNMKKPMVEVIEVSGSAMKVKLR